jgi:hypothetical protein
MPERHRRLRREEAVLGERHSGKGMARGDEVHHLRSAATDSQRGGNEARHARVNALLPSSPLTHWPTCCGGLE